MNHLFNQLAANAQSNKSKIIPPITPKKLMWESWETKIIVFTHSGTCRNAQCRDISNNWTFEVIFHESLQCVNAQVVLPETQGHVSLQHSSCRMKFLCHPCTLQPLFGTSCALHAENRTFVTT